MKTHVNLLSIALVGSFLSACGLQGHKQKDRGNADAANELAQALAGSTVRNGGDLVICQNNYAELSGKNIGILDLYEAKMKNLAVDLGPASETAAQKAARVLERLKDIDPTRYGTYSGYLKTFFEEASINERIHLPELSDEEVVELPGEDCKVSQVALQRDPELPGDKRYLIKKRLWDSLDSDNQAALILHEIIYRESRQHNDNSRRVRLFNGYLMANMFSGMDRVAYVQFLKDIANLPAIYRYQDFAFKLDSLSFYESGALKTGEITMSTFPFPTATYYSRDFGANAVQFYNAAITFFENGAIQSGRGTMMHFVQYDRSQGAWAPDAPSLYDGCSFKQTGHQDMIFVTDISFSEAGVLRSFTPKWEPLLPACAVGSKATQKPFFTKRDSAIEVHPNGYVAKATLFNQHEFTAADGKKVLKQPGETAAFNAQGELLP